MESLRQKVFFFLDNNQDIKNKDLYEKFEGKNESSLRDYKKQYLEKKAKYEELCQVFSQQSRLVITTKLDLIKRKGKNIFYEDIPESVTLPNQYDKIGKKSRKPSRTDFHIFPLLKTFKLLPLYIFLKVNEINNDIKDPEFSITEIYNSLVDNMNAGIYDIDEISKFSFNCKKDLKGFLDHISWKKNTIRSVNRWLGIILKTTITNYQTQEYRVNREWESIGEKELIQEYLKIKGKMLISFLPEFYGIYLYFRKKEVIVKDFSKACFLNNFGDNEPIGLTDLIKKYNDDLDYRNRPDKYHINFEYNESHEFLDSEE